MIARLRTRAILLVLGGALAPLLLLGGLAVYHAHSTVRAKVVDVDRDIAHTTAQKIEGDVARYVAILHHVGQTLEPANHLSPLQAERILKNYRLDVRDLRQLDYVGEDKREIATARADGKTRDRSGDPAIEQVLSTGRPFRSPVTISKTDAIPEIVLAEPQRAAGRVVGVVVATIDLTEMWRVVDEMKLGARGYARVVGEDGTLLAIGDDALKRLVFERRKDTSGDLVRRVLSGESPDADYVTADGNEVLAVGAPIERLGWGLILEQPLGEALAPYYRFTRIIVALAVALLAMAAIVGLMGARSVVDPIEKLRIRAGEIARGLLDARVEVKSPSELKALADAMNQMCEDLIRLQEDVRKRERIATLGRMAAGLAHDLKHPVQAIRAGARNLKARAADVTAPQTFSDVVEREVRKIDAFLEDLKRVSRGDEPMSIAKNPLKLGAFLQTWQSNQTPPDGIQIVVEAPAPPQLDPEILGNGDLLGRVLANLASNAYEAMEGEGTLTLRTCVQDGRAVLAVADTGSGIPADRIGGLFADFTTTKKRGLGLGLAVSKKIVVDHGGTIDVQSEPGKGTEFVIQLPLYIATTVDPQPPTDPYLEAAG